MKYADREDITGHTRKQYEAIAAIYAELQKKRKHINTTDLMIEINGIISTYVEIQHTPSIMREEPRRFDISAIDFDLLRREFAKVKKKNLVMHDLEEVIRQKLDRMLFTNPDRINYKNFYVLNKNYAGYCGGVISCTVCLGVMVRPYISHRNCCSVSDCTADSFLGH